MRSRDNFGSEVAQIDRKSVFIESLQAPKQSQLFVVCFRWDADADANRLSGLSMEAFQFSNSVLLDIPLLPVENRASLISEAKLDSSRACGVPGYSFVPKCKFTDSSRGDCSGGSGPRDSVFVLRRIKLRNVFRITRLRFPLFGVQALAMSPRSFSSFSRHCRVALSTR